MAPANHIRFILIVSLFPFNVSLTPSSDIKFPISTTPTQKKIPYSTRYKIRHPYAKYANKPPVTIISINDFHACFLHIRKFNNHKITTHQTTV